MNAPLEAIVFDIGNVLLEFDFRPAYEALAAKSSVNGWAAVEAALHPIKKVYEDGGVPREEFLRQSFRVLSYRGTEGEFEKAWREIFTINADMEKVVCEIRDRYPLFLLSNTNDIHLEYIFSQFPVFGLFRGGVYSHEVRVSKPESEIFQITRERFGLDPERTLFIDDLGPNVEAARAAGFKVHQYRRGAHGEFLRELGRLGVRGD